MTRIPSGRSSLAYWIVSAVSADLDGTYPAEMGCWSASAGSDMRVNDPTLLETLTMRGDAERRSSGSMALVTVMTPKTFVSNTRRTMSRSAVLGRWLAGPVLTLADLAAAAHLSVADYLGGLDWRGHKQTADWYMVMKSRPSFRPLLAERMEVIVPPPHYDKVDF